MQQRLGVTLTTHQLMKTLGPWLPTLQPKRLLRRKPTAPGAVQGEVGLSLFYIVGDALFFPEPGKT